MTGGVELQSARLLLRPLTTRDAEQLALYAGDWDVARMTARVPHPYSVTDAFQWIVSIEDREFVRAVMFDDALAGVCGAAPDPDAEATAEIGYWLGKPFWGRGIATEAAHALCSYCFGEGGYVRLTSTHFADNEGSRNVLRKLGFRKRDRVKCLCQARLQDVEAIRYDLVRRQLKRLRKR